MTATVPADGTGTAATFGDAGGVRASAAYDCAGAFDDESANAGGGGANAGGVNCAEKNAVLPENAQGKLALAFQVQPLMWYRLVALLALVEAS